GVLGIPEVLLGAGDDLLEIGGPLRVAARLDHRRKVFGIDGAVGGIGRHFFPPRAPAGAPPPKRARRRRVNRGSTAARRPGEKVTLPSFPSTRPANSDRAR